MTPLDGENGTEPWRTIVIGVRWWGERLASAIDERESAELVGVVDLETERAASVAEDLDVASFTDYDRAFSERQIDVAVVAVGPESHVPVATDCLENGAHTYLEKPAGPVDDPDAVLGLADLADENCVTLTPGFSQRYAPYVEGVIKAVRSGLIGRVRSIDALRQANWSPDPGSAPGWGVHDYDLCCLLADSPPQDIVARTPRIGGKPHPPTAEVLIQHENGVLSRCKTNISGEGLDVTLRVHGEDGDAIGRRQDQTIRLVTPDTEWEKTYAEAPHFADRTLDAFFESLSEGTAPIITANEVVHARRIETAVHNTLAGGE